MDKKPTTETSCLSCRTGEICGLALDVTAENGHVVMGEKHGGSSGLFALYLGLVQSNNPCANFKVRVFNAPKPDVRNRGLRASAFLGNLYLRHFGCHEVVYELFPVHGLNYRASHILGIGHPMNGNGRLAS